MFKKFNGAIDKSINFKFNQKILYAFFGLYVVVVSVTSYFHEPWYDELQAWQIAKCASIYDIIFTIPHYEGHPPLWHLLLAIFAKSGMNVDFSLHFVNILAMAGAVWILMFKTKIPDILKALLPFTYFMCYQYGVVSRPYSLMALAFILCGVCYKSKDEKPFRMMLSLLFLCLTSAYGLAYAFFICIAWLIEMYKNQHISFAGFVRYFVKTRTFVSLCVLFVCAVCILIMIIPSDDLIVPASSKESKMTLYAYAVIYLYMFLVLPFDATVGSVVTSDKAIVYVYDFSPKHIIYYILSLMIYFLLWKAMKSCKKTELMIPVFVMPIIFAQVFFCGHHVGIVTLYIVFLVCVYFDTQRDTKDFSQIDDIINNVFICFLYVMSVVQILWTVTSIVYDVQKNYYPGKGIASYINDNVSDDSYILPAGDYYGDIYSFDISVYATITLPYLDKNIYPSYHSGQDSESYVHNSYSLEIEPYLNGYGYDKIKALGKPEFIVGQISTDSDTDERKFEKSTESKSNAEALSKLLDYYSIQSDYEIVHDIPYGQIYKGHYIENYVNIFERKDLLK